MSKQIDNEVYRYRRCRLRFGHRTIEHAKIKSFCRTILIWWQKSKRAFPWRKTRASRYHQIISEILLQRTKAETIASFWTTFICLFPNWSSLAIASVEEIEKSLKPIGLSKQRAPRLHALAKIMTERHGRFPTKCEEIEKLPGIGQYIASAVLIFCYNASEPLLDVNMTRLIERYFGPRKLADIRFDPYLQNIARYIISQKDAKALNWAILDFSASCCTSRNPNCQHCPLLMKCNYGQKRNLIDQKL